MKISLERKNDNYHFELKNERGHIVNVDSRPEYGGDNMGPSPMELILMGVAGCSSIDMVSILKKQRQEITSYKAVSNLVQDASFPAYISYHNHIF